MDESNSFITKYHPFTQYRSLNEVYFILVKKQRHCLHNPGPPQQHSSWILPWQAQGKHCLWNKMIQLCALVLLFGGFFFFLEWKVWLFRDVWGNKIASTVLLLFVGCKANNWLALFSAEMLIHTLKCYFNSLNERCHNT